MSVCVKEVLDFATEDVLQIIEAIEVLRVRIVRLESRNRRLLKFEDVPIIHQNGMKAARPKVKIRKTEGWIDSDGRRFIYVKKVQDKVTEQVLSKKKRKRPTHRGRRNKSPNIEGIIKRCSSTFKGLVPEAKSLPDGLTKLVDMLFRLFMSNQTALRDKVHLQDKVSSTVPPVRLKSILKPSQSLKGETDRNSYHTSVK